ncbi:hypothetical protein [Capnocytophaga haemolytica]|uniref:hypothetical protein n=1 Tax=Capnocytophaga haemolytica TaxID=45243 RepID=UPI000A3EFB49|nr:hypothetical protein [Capnocytophaga haemolytica]
MKHTEKEAISIAERYRLQYPNLENTIKRAEYHSSYNVKGSRLGLLAALVLIFLC